MEQATHWITEIEELRRAAQSMAPLNTLSRAELLMALDPRANELRERYRASQARAQWTGVVRVGLRP